MIHFHQRPWNLTSASTPWSWLLSQGIQTNVDGKATRSLWATRSGVCISTTLFMGVHGGIWCRTLTGSSLLTISLHIVVLGVLMLLFWYFVLGKPVGVWATCKTIQRGSAATLHQWQRQSCLLKRMTHLHHLHLGPQNQRLWMLCWTPTLSSKRYRLAGQVWPYTLRMLRAGMDPQWTCLQISKNTNSSWSLESTACTVLKLSKVAKRW